MIFTAHIDKNKTVKKELFFLILLQLIKLLNLRTILSKTSIRYFV